MEGIGSTTIGAKKRGEVMHPHLFLNFSVFTVLTPSNTMTPPSNSWRRP